jgi:pre-mRNA-processing factor SLU7
MGEFDPQKPPDEGNLTGATLPEYVREQPWYFQTPDDAVGHQRIAPYAQQVRTELSEFYNRSRNKKIEVAKWKPGCCHNCGSNSHSEYDCPERPRKRNARMAETGIMVTKMSESHTLSFDAKHDMYASYDPNRWWHQVSGQFRYADKMMAQDVSSSEPTIPVIQAEYGNSGFRNRMDIAPYLQNLGSERIPIAKDDEMWVKASKQHQHENPKESVGYKREVTKERQNREFYESKQLLEKEIDSKDDLVQVEEMIPKSRYGDLEDQSANDHSSVFGSYFENGRWGYACCHQFVEDCFCTKT